MKKIALISVLVFVGFIFGQSVFLNHDDVEAEGGVQFYQGSFDEALALAKKENKLIFMDSYATWCGPCKRMSSEVFTKSSVGDLFNEKFINVKMDMEKGRGPELARKYRIKYYPTLLFIKPDGKIKRKEAGFHSDSLLLDIASKVLN